MNLRKPILAILALAAAVGLTGCDDDAVVVSENLSKAADNFEVMRRIVVVNSMTDTYFLEVEGRCAIVDQGNQLEITCKVAEGEGNDAYKKHFAGLSAQVTYFAEQVEAKNVSAYHYRYTYKPQQILPDVDVRGSVAEAEDAVKPD